MYTCIVVGTDGSSTAERAVETASHLARQWGAALHIVTAYQSADPGIGSSAGAPLVDRNLGQGLRQLAAQNVTDAAADLWGEAVDVNGHAVPGGAADAIIDVAEAQGADLIVVGSRGMRGARRILGSVPNSVSHGANCAVLIVKTD